MNLLSQLAKPILLLLCLHLVSAVRVYPRRFWTKRMLRAVRLRTPVQYVVVHHTVTQQCNSPMDCARMLRGIQTDHLRRRFPDIGYNFLISSDGSIYEGVGYGYRGSHASRYNSISYGIAFIGNFDVASPSQRMLQAARNLINHMRMRGLLRPNYKLIGHCQTKATICPGNRLHSEIRKWPNWSQFH